MPVDDLWFLASRAEQRAERAYHALTDAHDGFLEFDRRRSVSRRRFRTLAERVERTGGPYGAHTAVYREDGDLLLVRHDGVDLWVPPGGGVDDGESFREAAERELAEEAGVGATYCGLAMLTAVTFECGAYSAWGVVPVFEACADDTSLAVRDPDGEISDAAWFADLPEDTRDRGHLRRWRERALS
ncbi:NUDIX domain-containing protein [Halobacterium sp. R2-5]|uniref:NUDIX domain-containing protein n=1 Tax=Halobacterium sp. R2-5 TaxID=2715751 RepID=UPI0014215BFF|nr:NUDIX domain-containing protein [Halobacterium sp. R2-5]NIC00642.1 NUDIX domain-containing protein [Halobacterium sp. R2-5]